MTLVVLVTDVGGEGEAVANDRTIEGELIVLTAREIAVLEADENILVGGEIVAEAEGGGTVEFAAAVLGDGIDHTAHGIAILGAENTGDDLEVLDHILLDVDGAAAAAVRLIHLHAVDEIGDLIAAAAAKVAEHNARLHGDHRAHRFIGQNIHLGGGDVAHRAGLVFLDRDAVGDDRDLLAAEDGALEPGGELEGAVDRDAYILHAHALIADHRNAHRIGAGFEVDDEKLAVDVRRRAPACPLQQDIGAGEGFAGVEVGDLAGDLAGGLAEQSPGGEKQAEENGRQLSGHGTVPYLRFVIL